ncbi:MAG: thiol-disulfide isomerase/thioredoxin [Bacteroidia bacterium]|jgi:thiol-disulfide isomerase/thioredoxin
MAFVKKHWSNILLLVLVGLLLFPPTGKPIKVFIHQMIAFSPSVKSEQTRTKIETYNWLLKDESGNEINFNSFKGGKIIVNFWATWCPPCIAEMPSMQALYNDFGDDVVFLFVTQDDPTIARTFLDSRSLDLPVYWAVTAPIPEFEGNSLPTTYVINENQEIIVKKVGSANWNSDKMRKLLSD